jgi:hypothetical protein
MTVMNTEHNGNLQLSHSQIPSGQNSLWNRYILLNKSEQRTWALIFLLLFLIIIFLRFVIRRLG